AVLENARRQLELFGGGLAERLRVHALQRMGEVVGEVFDQLLVVAAEGIEADIEDADMADCLALPTERETDVGLQTVTGQLLDQRAGKAVLDAAVQRAVGDATGAAAPAVDHFPDQAFLGAAILGDQELLVAGQMDPGNRELAALAEQVGDKA